MYDEEKLGEEVLNFLRSDPADELDRLAHRAVRVLVDTSARSWDDRSHLPLARMLAHSTLFLISKRRKHYRFIPTHFENRATVDLSGEIVGFDDPPSTDCNDAQLVGLATARLAQAERIVGRETQNRACLNTKAQPPSRIWRAIMQETGDKDCTLVNHKPERTPSVRRSSLLGPLEGRFVSIFSTASSRLSALGRLGMETN